MEDPSQFAQGCSGSLSLHFVLQNGCERVGSELVATSFVELVLELNPVQS